MSLLFGPSRLNPAASRTALRMLCWLIVPLVSIGCFRPVVPSPDSDGIQFHEAALESGIDYQLSHHGRSPLDILETIGHGCAWVDYDQDGRSDLLLLGPNQVRLYHNERARFRDVTREQGLALPGYWIGTAVGDYDNDGWPDLLLNGYHCRALLRNEHGRGFHDRTISSNLADRASWGTSAAFIDLDQDGFLDLVIGRYAELAKSTRRFCDEDGVAVMCAPRTYPLQRVQCFKSLGGRRFVDETKRWGFDHTAGRNLAIVPFDFDNDGWTDVYLANDTEPGDLMHSLRGERFENVGLQSGTALSDNGKPLAGMGLDAQDVDGDGQLDLAVTTFEREPKCLWHNLGDSQFEDRSSALGLDSMRGLLSWGVGLVDFDNDSRCDLLYASGHVFAKRSYAAHRYELPLQLFRGSGDGFQNVSAGLEAAVRKPLVARGSAFADYDNDGRMDAVISNLEGRALLLHNTTRQVGHWLVVKLEGKRSNRMGLGARLTLEAVGKRWVAEAKTARSVYSASDARVHFGLGSATQVDRITVRWPSGRSSSVNAVQSDQVLSMVEPLQ